MYAEIREFLGRVGPRSSGAAATVMRCTDCGSVLVVLKREECCRQCGSTDLGRW